MATTATDYTRYRCDVNYHDLKVGDIVRITKATKSTMAYKKFDWVVVKVTGYMSVIKPHKYPFLTLPGTGEKSDKEQTWDNSRLTWQSTPAAPVTGPVDVFVGKSKKYKVGDKVTLTNTASWDKDYEGLPAEVLPETSSGDDSLYLKPLKPRPNLLSGTDPYTPFWIEEAHIVLTKDYVGYPTKSPFAVGDVVVNSIYGTGKVLELKAGGSTISSHTVKVKFPTLTDWFNPMGLKLAENQTSKKTFKVGDIVQIKTSSSDAVIKLYNDLPARVDKLATETGFFKGKVHLVPLRDRPNTVSDEKRVPFWWKEDELVEFNGVFLPGDRVKVTGASSTIHPVGSVGTVKEKAGFGYTVTFASGNHDHSHSMGTMILTDEPLTADYGIDPFEAPKLEPKFQVGSQVKIKANGSAENPVGSIGKIVGEVGLASESNTWVVRFKGNTTEHWHTNDELELVADEPKKLKSSDELEVGDFVEVLSHESWTYPMGSVGKIVKIDSGSYKPIKVAFKDTPKTSTVNWSHHHAHHELKHTFDPWDDTASAKKKWDAKKTGKNATVIAATENLSDAAITTAVMTMSDSDIKKLKALDKIAELMKDKSMSPVIRTELIAGYLKEVGMFK